MNANIKNKSAGKAREKRRFISEKTDEVFFVKLPKNVRIFLIGCIWLSNWKKG